ncbi:MULTISPECIES: hypothetical protein [Bacteroides]|uniref:hypothetical protein n=1 Tax=Bacteroides TaxID=816 RepID=UPI0008DAF888|nr:MULTISPECIES: hypothetical protein [Bacteroides]
MTQSEDNFNNLVYNSGCFFIKQPIEPDKYREDKYSFDSRIKNYLSYSPIADIDSTRECIHFWHELNHYVQDLSNFACILEAEISDWIAGHIKFLSHHPDIRFPLLDAKNIEYNNKLTLNEEYAQAKEELRKIIDLKNYLFEQKHKKPKDDEYNFHSPNESFLDNYAVSFKDLIECSANNKSFWDVFYMAENNDECKLLHQIANEEKLFPYKFENEKINIDILKLKANHEYQLVNHIIIIFIAFIRNDYRELFDYYKHDIPLNLRKSKAEEIYNITRCILEVSMNIPSLEYILNKTETGTYKKEDFCPPLRLYKIIKAVRDNQGFPAAKDNEDFYITFHDWVSTKLGWPTYEETYQSIDHALMKRFFAHKENMITEQLNGILIKKEQYKDFLNWPALRVLQYMHQKILFCNGQGLEIIHLLGNYIIYNTGLTNFYTEWFNSNIRERQLLFDFDSDKEKIRKILENNQGSIRETLCRLFSHAVKNTFLETGYFQCPLNQTMCPHHGSYCQKFKQFDSIKKRCRMRISRLPEGNYIVPEGMGNSPDCMLYNYILDLEFNLKKIF